MVQLQVYYISIDMKHTLITPHIHKYCCRNGRHNTKTTKTRKFKQFFFSYSISDFPSFSFQFKLKHKFLYTRNFVPIVVLCFNTHIHIHNTHTHTQLWRAWENAFSLATSRISFFISAKASELGEYNSTQKHYSYITSIQVQ